MEAPILGEDAGAYHIRAEHFKNKTEMKAAREFGVVSY
jgi:hypothetical protein